METSVCRSLQRTRLASYLRPTSLRNPSGIAESRQPQKKRECDLPLNRERAICPARIGRANPVKLRGVSRHLRLGFRRRIPKPVPNSKPEVGRTPVQTLPTGMGWLVFFDLLAEGRLAKDLSAEDKGAVSLPSRDGDTRRCLPTRFNNSITQDGTQHNSPSKRHAKRH